MIGTEFVSLIRLYTNANSVTLTNANIVLLAQAVKDYVLAPKVSGTKEGKFEVPAYRDLPAYSSVSPTREFGLPDDILDALVKVEIDFIGDGSYIKVGEISQVQIPESETESNIVNRFSTLEVGSGDVSPAKYDKRRDSIFLYCGAWVTSLVPNGIKIFYNAFPQAITTNDLSGSTDLSIPATTTSVTLPRIFHELWARGVSKMWKETRDKPLPLSQLEQVFDRDLADKVSEYRNSNDDLSLTADLPNDRRLQGV